MEEMRKKCELKKRTKAEATETSATTKAIVVFHIFLLRKLRCRDERNDCNRGMDYHPIFSFPKYGTRGSGMRIDPSACWKFSTRETKMRGVGMAVALSEWA